MMIVRNLPVLMPGTTAVTTVKVKNLPNIVTDRNEVVAKVMFLQLCVILFTGGVCLSACWDTTPQGDPQEGDPPRRRHPPSRPPKKETPKKESASRPTPKGKLRGIRSRPTPKGEIEGDQIQPPPTRCRIRHTVNERPVRILLECILVLLSHGLIFLSVEIRVVYCIYDV